MFICTSLPCCGFESVEFEFGGLIGICAKAGEMASVESKTKRLGRKNRRYTRSLPAVWQFGGEAKANELLQALI
jgi:hypothetical protein